MANFTPGPWNIHRSYPLESEVRSLPASKDHSAFENWSCSIAKGDKIIADVVMRRPDTGGWPHVEDLDEAKANALVMMQAPELLEMLKRVDAEFDRIFRALPDDVPDNMLPDASLRNEIDDLIAKAEGKAEVNA